MNDAINSQGYAQAAAWNRIPLGAWMLLYVLGGIATGMIGYRFRIEARQNRLMLVMSRHRGHGILSDRRYRLSKGWGDPGRASEPAGA